MTPEAFILALISALTGSGICSVVIVTLQRKWQTQDSRDERIDALVEGTKMLMTDRIRHLGKSYLNDKAISLEDKENIKGMYLAYKRLGGNGHLDTVMNEVNNLKLIEF